MASKLGCRLKLKADNFVVPAATVHKKRPKDFTMNETLFQRIKTAVSSANLILPKASLTDIHSTESILGYEIPEILKKCYLEIGNGGFGPGGGPVGGGILGVGEEGYRSDFGNLTDTYDVCKVGYEYDGNDWPKSLIPFCEWGCNTFAHIDCSSGNMITISEDLKLFPQEYNLDDFFEIWLQGKDVLSEGLEEEPEIQIIINPFTGKATEVVQNKRKAPE